MGFITNLTISDRIPVKRTYLEAVQRVVRATGQDAPTSITGSPPNHIARAKAAVDDALQRVFNAALWDFRCGWAYLKMENQKIWYELPGDWAKRNTDLLPQNFSEAWTGTGSEHQMSPVRFVRYERVLEHFPEFCLPPEGQIHDGGLVHLTSTIAYKENVLKGVPEIFTIKGNYLGLYPIPDEDAENFNIDSPLNVAYWFRLNDLTENSDEIPLPPELLVPMHFLALAYYKQAMEYSDFQADEARGENLLMVEMAKSLQVQADTQHNLVSEEYGQL